MKVQEGKKGMKWINLPMTRIVITNTGIRGIGGEKIGMMMVVPTGITDVMTGEVEEVVAGGVILVVEEEETSIVGIEIEMTEVEGIETMIEIEVIGGTGIEMTIIEIEMKDIEIEAETEGTGETEESGVEEMKMTGQIAGRRPWDGAVPSRR